MGEMADYYIEQEIEDTKAALGRCGFTPIGGGDQWPSSDGTVISISDMNDGHLINAIAKVKREKWRLEFLPILEKEKKRRNL